MCVVLACETLKPSWYTLQITWQHDLYVLYFLHVLTNLVCIDANDLGDENLQGSLSLYEHFWCIFLYVGRAVDACSVRGGVLHKSRT